MINPVKSKFLEIGQIWFKTSFFVSALYINAENKKDCLAGQSFTMKIILGLKTKLKLFYFGFFQISNQRVTSLPPVT